jgi:PadR family transcriptional regulator, regulatory protein PadR
LCPFDIFNILDEMKRTESLGYFELLVLLAALRVGDDAYGVSITHALEDAIGQETAVASVYAALQRLEAKGLIRTRLGDPTPARGGRAKRHVVVTAAGRRQAVASQRTLQRLRVGILEPESGLR